MTKRTVVIRKKSSYVQPKTKRNIPIQLPKMSNAAGFISPVFVVLACTVFSGLFYVYSINQTAVKGIAVRSAEKEIADRKKENESLKIKEAELKSLYRIEQATRQMDMADVQQINYLEENPSVAFASQNHKN